MAIGGLLADARQIVERARNEAASYRSEYKGDVPLKHLTDNVAMYMHAHTLYSAVRPYGCGVILGSCDEHTGPEMYMIDPSGVYHGYFACALGKAKQAAKTEMEKIKFKEMDCSALIKEAAKIIYVVHDEVKDKSFELELSWVGKHTNGLHQRVPASVFAEAEKYAKESLEEDSDSDIEADPVDQS